MSASRTCIKFAGLLLLFLGAIPCRAEWRWNVTVLPNASIRYRGEGKVPERPQGYANRFEGETSPVYRLEFFQAPSPRGYWTLALWHAGVFGGGKFAAETIPDQTAGGLYQSNGLNVGFTNLFVTRRLPLKGLPLEALAGFSVVREIFKRRSFIVQGVDARPSGLDDVTEISAEGFGFGLAGRHGRKVYVRWQALANYYVQLFDAKTDASAGQIFQAESGVGARLGKGFSLELGGLWQYWFIPGQGNRRLFVPGTTGAVISWNRQETIASGLLISLRKKF